MSLKELKGMTDTTVGRFSLEGKNVSAKVVQVYDGDTCDLAFCSGRKIVRYNCRLKDINTSELRKKRGKVPRDAKGRDAKIARDFLAWLCTGNKAEEFNDKKPAWTETDLQKRLNESEELVYAKLGSFGQKHGRLLVTLKRTRHESKTFNQLLLDEKYARKYRGNINLDGAIKSMKAIIVYLSGSKRVKYTLYLRYIVVPHSSLRKIVVRHSSLRNIVLPHSSFSLQQLKGITAHNVSRSPFSPPTNGDFYAKVVTVHDGDTCDLVFYCNGSYQRFKCRLLGINWPELKDGNIALKSRDFLTWLCLGCDPAQFPRLSQPWSEAQLQNYLNASQVLVYAEFDGVGGYGRPLVTLKGQEGGPRSFNQLLMDHGYASVYRK